MRAIRYEHHYNSLTYACNRYEKTDKRISPVARSCSFGMESPNNGLLQLWTLGKKKRTARNLSELKAIVGQGITYEDRYYWTPTLSLKFQWNRDPHTFDRCDVFISTVSIAELYALSGMSKDEERRIDAALLFLSIVPLTKEIAKERFLARTWTKRSQRRIAHRSNSVGAHIPIITKNIRDFSRIRGLMVRNEP